MVAYWPPDQAALDRGDEHGCCEPNPSTGEPMVCRECAYPRASSTGERCAPWTCDCVLTRRRACGASTADAVNDGATDF